jgi:SAM-dependent methyltransferase
MRAVDSRRSRKPIAPDYDRDPERFRLARSVVRRHGLADDIHERVARRLLRERLTPVLDVGCGEGELARHLPRGHWVGLDASAEMLARAPQPAVRGDARALPFTDAAYARWRSYTSSTTWRSRFAHSLTPGACCVRAAWSRWRPRPRPSAGRVSAARLRHGRQLGKAAVRRPRRAGSQPRCDRSPPDASRLGRKPTWRPCGASRGTRPARSILRRCHRTMSARVARQTAERVPPAVGGTGRGKRRPDAARPVVAKPAVVALLNRRRCHAGAKPAPRTPCRGRRSASPPRRPERLRRRRRSEPGSSAR